jgi:hypothetical protein
MDAARIMLRGKSRREKTNWDDNIKTNLKGTGRECELSLPA